MMTRIFGLFCALLMAQNCFAQVEPPQVSDAPTPRVRPVRNMDLYSTTVELLSQSDAAKTAAYSRALVQVVNQLTGLTNAGGNPVIRSALGNAQKWLSTTPANPSASDSEGNTLVGGSPVVKASMRVNFDPSPIDTLIAAAGLKYWTGDRPKPLLWLTIDDGKGARLVTAKQLNVIKSLSDRGVQRGIRFLVPQGTAAELALAPSAVQNLDGMAVQGLSARYGNNVLLIGKVYRSVSGWSAWWLLWNDGAELTRWPMTMPDARQVIASGADNTANYFAKRDSVYLDAGRSGIMLVEISNINTMNDYVRVMSYLQSQGSVRTLDVQTASAGKLLLRVDLKSGINAFRGLMRSGSVLQPLANGIESSSAADQVNTVAIERFALK